MHPRTKPATAPCDIPPDPVSVPSNGVEALVDFAVACEAPVVLASTATPSAILHMGMRMLDLMSRWR